MADDTDLSIKIGADASGVQAGAAAASQAMGGLGDQATDFSQISQAQFDAMVANIQATAKSAVDALAPVAAGAGSKMADAQKKAAEDTKKAWTESVSTVVRSFGSGLLGMARGSTSFSAVVKKVGESAENAFARSVENTVTKFIVGEGTKTAAVQAGQVAQNAATKTAIDNQLSAEQEGHSESLLMSVEATLKQITNNAASAATAAFQAMAGIPIVGPELGAAAAAATFTAVEAFGAIASASGGYDIGNENPLTQLHAKEMVLPASIAEPLRGMIGAGGAGSSAASGGGAQNITHNWAVQSFDSRDVRRWAGSARGQAAINQVSGAKR